MALPFKKEHLESLVAFITYAKLNPLIMHNPQLHFFKEFIEHFGGKIPAAPETDNCDAKSTSTESKESKPEPESEPEPESDESDVELDMTGVIESDTDAPQEMGDSDKVSTEDEITESQEKRSEAVAAFSEKNYEKAVKIYTEAILLNPQSALFYAKRGQAYLELKKPNACIRDCNRALELNPDSAAAHKFRGRANQLLGKWEEAASDLRLACKFDFDEQANEWLKQVTPNAHKIEEHKRKKERKLLEKQEKERLERLKKAREAAAKAREENAQTSQPDGTDAPGFGDLPQFLNDPDVVQAFKDPEIITAFNDISSNPANILKYQSNPKVMALINKMAAKFGGAAGMQGMAGMAGMMGGMPGGFPGARNTPSDTPKPSGPSDDVGLD